METRGVVIQQSNAMGNVAVQHNVSQPNFVSATRGLGITQIILGSLTILFGIAAAASLHYWVGNVGFGIWGGIWILIGGILGVMSAGNPTNSNLNGTNMAFAIVSCVICSLHFIFYCIAITYFRHYYSYCSYWTCSYRSNSTGVALYVILLLLVIAEFVAALSAAIYCCKSNNCCQSGTQGTVVFQPAQQVVFQPAPVVSSGYPAPVSAYPGQQVSFVTTMPPPGAYNPPQYTPQAKAFEPVPPPYTQ